MNLTDMLAVIGGATVVNAVGDYQYGKAIQQDLLAQLAQLRVQGRQASANEKAKQKAGEAWLIAFWSVIDSEDVIPSSLRAQVAPFESMSRTDRLFWCSSSSERLYEITLSGGDVDRYMAVEDPNEGDRQPTPGVFTPAEMRAMYSADIPWAQLLLDKYGQWMSDLFAALDGLGIMVLGWYPDRTRGEYGL